MNLKKITNYLPYLAALFIIGFGVAFIIQMTKANKWHDRHLESEGAFKTKNTAYIELKKKTDAEKLKLAQERDVERKARKESDKRIGKIREESRRKDNELIKAKARISELTPDELTNELNARVPDQFTLLELGDFHLTRYGGEQTFSIFIDEERCAEKLKEKDDEIAEFDGKEKSFKKEISKWQKAIESIEDTLAGCDEARLGAIKSKEDLQRAYKAMKWKQFGKGAAGSLILLAVILKICGVI